MYVDLSQASITGLQLRRDVASGQLKLNGSDQAKVTLILEDGSPYALPGVLQFSGTTVDPATGTVTVRALFPNPKHVLLPGMFVRARVEQGVNDRALLVPVRGISHDPKGQATALVVGPDSKVLQRPVQTQNMLGDAWVVSAGLNDGERVVVAGLQKVQPGMQVKAVEAPGQPAPALTRAAVGGATPQSAAPSSAVTASNQQ
jgi:membrane fusion protein (multidrug efflux system)